ncbi:tryptase-2-like [Cololabis saira]|uniref:tryptase-2-like n=1 Tax=Cololabis saira TaxID=129043 RepID=UPI002AD373E4|nr:tryptase-2-like [Cololabis saira]
MTLTACRLLAVLVLLHRTAGVLGADARSSIIGGKNSVKGRWPGMVHLTITTETGSPKWRCGATIVSKKWLLTSAHCFDESRKPVLRRSGAWLGALSLQNGADRYMFIDSLVRHPEYRNLGDRYENDIALVRLQKEVRFPSQVKTVKLPDGATNDLDSSECWITGWGQVGNAVPLPKPETLQEVKISIMPEVVCKSVYPLLPANSLCAGTKAGGKDACEGDLGGPLMCRSGGAFVQVGIMSSASCGVPGRPGIYTRVSKHLRFINDYIHQYEEASAEV